MRAVVPIGTKLVPRSWIPCRRVARGVGYVRSIKDSLAKVAAVDLPASHPDREASGVVREEVAREDVEALPRHDLVEVVDEVLPIRDAAREEDLSREGRLEGRAAPRVDGTSD